MHAAHAQRVEIDEALVRRLIAAQFPEWTGLPITPAVPQGWDNRTFRLGADLSVRLPSAEGYTPQVEKEHRWLPFLASRLTLPIPAPVALGMPGPGFPWRWSVYRWLEGQPANVGQIDDLVGLARALAAFLTELQRVDPTGGPAAGFHSAFRGGPLTTYDAETRSAVETLGDAIDTEGAMAVWEAALAAAWQGRPVWFHGDVAAGNLLVRDGRLAAVIDFGCSGVGDPACDTVIAWTLFSGESREAFRAALPVDRATWARGRGWALWKGLITVDSDDPAKSAEARRVVGEVIAEHRRGM